MQLYLVFSTCVFSVWLVWCSEHARRTGCGHSVDHRVILILFHMHKATPCEVHVLDGYALPIQTKPGNPTPMACLFFERSWRKAGTRANFLPPLQQWFRYLIWVHNEVPTALDLFWISRTSLMGGCKIWYNAKIAHHAEFTPY